MFTNSNTAILPVTGARLAKFRFLGNGKDSVAHIEVEGSRKAIVSLTNAQMKLDLPAGIPIATRGWGDTGVLIEIVPSPECPVTIVEAAIQSPTGEECWEQYWARSLNEYAATGCWTLDWCLQLRLHLAAC